MHNFYVCNVRNANKLFATYSGVIRLDEMTSNDAGLNFFSIKEKIAYLKMKAKLYNELT